MVKCEGGMQINFRVKDQALTIDSSDIKYALLSKLILYEL